MTGVKELNNTVREHLCRLLALRGVELCQDQGLCIALLKDLCKGQYKLEVRLLQLALDGMVAQDMLDARDKEPVPGLLGRLVHRLVSEQGMTPENADWAVKTWALGLNIRASTEAITPCVEPHAIIPALDTGVTETVAPHAPIGRFVVKRVLRENSLYCWLAASDDSAGEIILQVLNKDITRLKVNQTQDYFQRLLELRSPLLWTPNEITSDGDGSLVVCYPAYPPLPIATALEADPQRFAKWSRQAGEALECLHAGGLLHGCVSPDSLVVVGDDVKLTNFGYARLLGMGHQDAMNICIDFVAPETQSETVLKNVSDLYGLAKTLSLCRPEIERTTWYGKATAQRPGNRHASAREFIEELVNVFPSIGIEIESNMPATTDSVHDEPTVPLSVEPAPVAAHQLEQQSEPDQLRQENRDFEASPEDTSGSGQLPDQQSENDGLHDDSVSDVDPDVQAADVSDTVPGNASPEPQLKSITPNAPNPWKKNSEQAANRAFMLIGLLTCVILVLVGLSIYKFLSHK